MAAKSDKVKNWEQIAAELRVYRNAERAIWGEIDDMTIARFVAGTASESERRRVSEAMARYPAVSELVRSLEELMGELPSFGGEPAVPTDSEAVGIWEEVAGERRLVQSLAIWLERGQMVTRGLSDLFTTPSFLALGREDPTQSQAAIWSRIPLAPGDAVFSLSVRPPTDGVYWEIMLEVRSETEPDFGASALIEVDHGVTGQREMAIRLQECLNQPIYLASGIWRVTIRYGGDVWQIPLRLGEESSVRR